MPIEAQGISLHDHLVERKDGLLTDSSVCALHKLDDGQIKVVYRCKHSVPDQQQLLSEVFDSVILTTPSWLIETNMRLEGFTKAMLPQPIMDAWKHAHWETSCKVYAPLQKRFLDEHPHLPQILVTDSFVHDVYAYRYNDRYADDCILLSYTWEDDATKLARSQMRNWSTNAWRSSTESCCAVPILPSPFRPISTVATSAYNAG